MNLFFGYSEQIRAGRAFRRTGTAKPAGDLPAWLARLLAGKPAGGDAGPARQFPGRGPPPWRRVPVPACSIDLLP